MANRLKLRDLESQLYWCWHWYLLRVWQDCGSFNSASDFDRRQIAEQMRAETEGRSKEWALAGLVNFVDHLISKLDHLDPEVRQDAAIGLGDLGEHAKRAVPLLLDRLRSSLTTTHDRTCAAWALPRIGVDSEEVIPILLAILDEDEGQSEGDKLRQRGELRQRSAESIENLTHDDSVLMIVAQHCLRDRYWKCRMHGLFLVERLLKSQPDLRDGFVPLIEPLLNDHFEEIRDHARRILIGREEVV